MQPHKGSDGKQAKASGISEQDSLTTLYFGNLHPLVTVQVLQELCSYYGVVEQYKVIKDKATGQSAGYGFVKFADRRAADIALHSLQGKLLFHQEIRVNWAFQSHQREDTSNHHHIFVGDIGQEVTDAVLLQAFASQFSSCSDARVMWDHNTGRSKGYGFVSFRSKEEAEVAIQKMQGQYIASRRVRCGLAQHKQDESQPPPDFDNVDRQDPSNCNVYVGNISPEWTEADVQQHFSVFGPVVEVKLHKKGGYGFVRFEAHSDAVAAIVGLHGKEVGGRLLKCSWGKNASSTSGNSGNVSPMPSPIPSGFLQQPMPMMVNPMNGMLTTPQGMVPGMMMQPHGAMTVPPSPSGLMLMGGQGNPGGMGGPLSRHNSLPMDPHMFYGSMFFGPG